MGDLAAAVIGRLFVKTAVFRGALEIAVTMFVPDRTPAVLNRTRAVVDQASYLFKDFRGYGEPPRARVPEAAEPIRTSSYRAGTLPEKLFGRALSVRRQDNPASVPELVSLHPTIIDLVWKKYIFL